MFILTTGLYKLYLSLDDENNICIFRTILYTNGFSVGYQKYVFFQWGEIKLVRSSQIINLFKPFYKDIVRVKCIVLHRKAHTYIIKRWYHTSGQLTEGNSTFGQKTCASHAIKGSTVRAWKWCLEIK